MIEERLQAIRDSMKDIIEEDIFFPPLNNIEEQKFKQKFKEELNVDPEKDYLSLLKITDGLVCQGVFIYSAISRSYPYETDGSASMEIIEINQMFRESGAYDDSVVIYGDSDTDQFIHDRSAQKFKVIAKGAPDVVFEEYDAMQDLLSAVVKQIEDQLQDND